MKKLNYVIAVLLFCSLILKAQDKKESKFSVLGFGGIGYGVLTNENAPNYNLNSNNGEILLNYYFTEKIGIATGLGLNELSGNGFDATDDFFHERTLLKIPVMLNLKLEVSELFSLTTNLGVFGQNIIKDEYSYLNNTQKDVYEGWNFGVQFGVGFLFKVDEKFSAGLHMNAQTDLSNVEAINKNIDNDQKFEKLNSIGLIFIWKF